MISAKEKSSILRRNLVSSSGKMHGEESQVCHKEGTDRALQASRGEEPHAAGGGDAGAAGGFTYKRKQNKKGEEVGGIVPHITLKSIVNNEPRRKESVGRS